MAKLYRTSGTGNAQQTLDVNDEKIKIYADEASLDADLANINENEIVATNEEDSQKAGTQYPVDVVQDGNMNAVTSNAVAGLFEDTIYSNTASLYEATHRIGKLLITEIRKIVQVPSMSASGSIYYYEVSPISFPVEYAAKPTVSLSTEQNTLNGFIWGAAQIPSKTDTGSFYIGRGTSSSGQIVVHVIAIGTIE